MRDIEKHISPLIASQFPSFYREEGPNFIAFVKAYYEWLESSGNAVGEARNLLSYKDIDTTTDDFILSFKEKYLKNIQFDTATNKKLLIKNSLDLYRSKGSENSIDLFFKLVYGTNAEVKNPGENVFKLSSGVWEKPTYLEVTETNRNIDYVGKQIIGSISGATAFVEKYIKRKTSVGYVAILQISNIVGNFDKGEIISLNSGSSQTTYPDSPRLIGSMNEIIIQDGSRGFSVGDIVNVQSSFSGIGGLARVSAVSDTTGAVDFIFIDGGWGYTTSAQSIISEKVLFLENVKTNPGAVSYFSTFEPIIQPIVDVTYISTYTPLLGDLFVKRDLSGNVTASLRVVQISSDKICLSVESGVIVAGETYVLSSDSLINIQISEIQNRTISSKVMTNPSEYNISITEEYGDLSIGDTVYQSDKQSVIAQGVVSSIIQTNDGKIIGLNAANGAFRSANSSYVVFKTSSKFNGFSNVNDTSNIWAISIANNAYVNDDRVIYRTGTSTTPISGLANNRSYFVVSSNSSAISLSETIDGSKISIIKSPSSSPEHFIDNNNTNLAFMRVGSNSTFIDASLDLIKFKNNNLFSVGDIVTYTIESSLSPIGGLISGSKYFVVYSDIDGIKLSLRYDGVPVQITPTLNNTVGHIFESLASIRAKSPSNVTYPDYYSNFSNLDMNIGVTEISKTVYEISFTNSSLLSEIKNSEYVYQYSDTGNLVSKFRSLTLEQATANSGVISGFPVYGKFNKNRLFYTESNSAFATCVDYNGYISGGDYIVNPYTKMFGGDNFTSFNTTRQSLGSGAGFKVNTTGDTEVIYINTDILSANAVQFIDDKRQVLTLTNPGIAIGDMVIQNQTFAFNGNTTSVLANGFITMTTTGLVENDLVEYRASGTRIGIKLSDTANTLVANGQQFFVTNMTPSGLSLRSNFEGVTETFYTTTSNTNHSLVKLAAAGTVTANSSTNLTVADVFGRFSNTAGLFSNVISTTTSANASVTNTANVSPIVITDSSMVNSLIRNQSYGFIKNPQGGFNDTIFSSLTFNRFNIGTIGGINSIDPGSEYNADPYVLIYQPYISEFDRHDFIFNIENATGSFVTGERITQTSGQSIEYSLKLQDNQQDTDYEALVRNVDPKFDIDAANNFIYVRKALASFNSNTSIGRLKVSFNGSGDVNPVDNFIQISQNPFVDGDILTYVSNNSSIGLSNNSTYTVESANTTGIKLSSGGTVVSLNKALTSGGTNELNKTASNLIAIQDHQYSNTDLVKYYKSTSNTANVGLIDQAFYKVANTSRFGFNLVNVSTSAVITLNVSNTEVGHNIVSYNNDNLFTDDELVLYKKYSATDTNIGLTSNTGYYVLQSNTVGFKLTSQQSNASAILDITATSNSEATHYIQTIGGFVVGDSAYQTLLKTFNSNTGVSANAITISNNIFLNNDLVRYYTGASGTSITGANNAYYYVTNRSNTSIQLKTSLGSNTAIALTPTSTVQTHNIETVTTGLISNVFNANGDSYVALSTTNRPPVSTYSLKSNTNPYISNIVDLVTESQKQIISDGFVKSSNNSTILVKRINFENNFTPGIITGEFSGTSANLISVLEDTSTNQIGLNAVIEANVVTSNGTIRTLDVVDSGFGYSNSEIIQFTSSDSSRSGTGKVVISDYGKSKGYYKSTKGFLSNDSKIHDGDYYQEYSYEILTKISFDRYKDMFKKVLHLAGTRVFGSAQIVEENDINLRVANIQTNGLFMFNPGIDISSNRINVGTNKKSLSFNSFKILDDSDFITLKGHSFVEDQKIKYTTRFGVTPNIGLSNNGIYFIKSANTTGFSLSTTRGGNKTPLTPTGGTNYGHNIVELYNSIDAGDVVEYDVEKYPFNSIDNIDYDTDEIFIGDTTVDVGDSLRYISVAKSPVVGLENNKRYSVASSNSGIVTLTDGQRQVSVMVNTTGGADNLTVHVIDSRNYSDVDFSNLGAVTIPRKTFTLYGSKLEVSNPTERFVVTNYKASTFDVNDVETVVSTFDTSIADKPYAKITVIIYDAVDTYIETNSFNLSGVNSNKYINLSEGLQITSKYKLDERVVNDVVGVLPLVSQGRPVDMVSLDHDFGRTNVDYTNNFISFYNSITPILGSSSNTNNIGWGSDNDLQWGTGNILTWGINFGDTITFTVDMNTNVSNGSILKNSHDLLNGDIVSFANTKYFVVNSSTNSFKMSNSYGGNSISISSSPTSNVVTITRNNGNSNNLKINVGDVVKYSPKIRNVPINGLFANQEYTVSVANSSGIRLSNTTITKTVSSIDVYTDIDSEYDFIILDNNSFVNNDKLLYTKTDGYADIPGLTSQKTINPSTAISNGAITVSGFYDSQEVLYYTNTGNTVIGGLTNNNIYFVNNSGNNQITLKTALINEPITVTAGLNEAGHNLVPIYYVQSSNNVGIRVGVQPNSKAVAVEKSPYFSYSVNGFTAISNTNETVAVANLQFVNNTFVNYSTKTSITPISGLANGTYVVRDANTSSFKLSSTLGGSIINLTSTKTKEFTFNSTTNVNATTDKINIVGHTYSTNDRVLYTAATPVGGLTSGNVYYVKNAEVNFIQLSSTLTGNVIELTPAVGTSTLEIYQEDAHTFTTAISSNSATLEKIPSDSGYGITVINNNGYWHMLLKRDPVSELQIGNKYFVTYSDEDSIEISATAQGNSIALSTGLNEDGHYLRKIIEE